MGCSQLAQHIQGLFRPVLLDKTQYGIEKDNGKNSRRIQVLTEQNGDNHRAQKHQHHEVLKLSEENPPGSVLALGYQELAPRRARRPSPLLGRVPRLGLVPRSFSNFALGVRCQGFAKMPHFFPRIMDSPWILILRKEKIVRSPC